MKTEEIRFSDSGYNGLAAKRRDDRLSKHPNRKLVRLSHLLTNLVRIVWSRNSGSRMPNGQHINLIGF
jgi:hypothetical protein